MRFMNRINNDTFLSYIDDPSSISMKVGGIMTRKTENKSCNKRTTRSKSNSRKSNTSSSRKRSSSKK